MRSLFILLLAIFCLLRISASDRVDSLNKVLTLYKNEGDIHATISTLTELGLSHQRNQKFKEALLHFKQAHQLSLRHGPKEEEVTLKVKLGTTLSWMDEYDESLRYHLQALTLKDLLSPKEVASLLVQISQTYRFKGDYANAAKHQYQGLAISESIQDSMGIVLGHFMLSSIYNYSGQDEKAYEESYKAYDAYQLYFPDEVSEYLHLIIHGVASVESKQEDLTKYEYFTRRSMEVALELDHGYTIASSHGAMGSMHLTMGVFDSAAYYFSKAVTYFEEAGIKQDQGLYQEHLGAAYRELGEIPKSMESLNKALVIAKEIDATDLEKRVYEELYLNYEALGYYEEANTYMKKYIFLKDSILSEANQKKVDELREQYEIQKRETEIEELKAENQKRINRLYLLALIFGVAFFVVIFWLLYVRYKSKARGNEVLLKKNNEIAYQNKQLSSLHDDLLKFSEIVSKDLTGALMNVRRICQQLGNKSQAYEKDIEGIETNLDEMEEVLYGLIVYSMTGSKEDKFEIFDSKELIAETLSTLPIHIRNKSLKISLHNLPNVLANKAKFSQLFSYLVSYSLKHQDDSYSIIKISSKEHEDEYEFIIHNEGTGIPNEQAANIFKVLSQEEASPYSDIELAVSRKIVEQHKGKIWVKPNEEHGVSFHFTIPKREELINA